MLADRIENIGEYRGLHSRLDEAIAYLEKEKWDDWQDRRVDIEGDSLYALQQSYETSDAMGKPYEAHKKYIDVQYVVRGREALLWSPITHLELTMKYSEDLDASFLRGEDGVPLYLKDGMFTVLFPQDAHKPGCIWANSMPIKKIVVKVRI